MVQYSVKTQQNKIYNDNERDYTAKVAWGGLALFRNVNDTSAVTLNTTKILHHETYLEIIAEDGEYPPFYLSFSTGQDLKACYYELTKWSTRTLDSAYEISDDDIGSGVGGNVYIGESKKRKDRGTKVAIKTIEWNASDEVFMNVYLEEHENLLPILDVLRHEYMTYIVMPLLKDAQDVDVFVKKRSIPQKQSSVYMRQILSGLAHMHAAGIHHGDLNFGNVMLQRKLEKATIIDLGFSNFGIPKQSEDIKFCGKVLALMGKPSERVDEQLQELIDLLNEGKITAEEALAHDWLEDSPAAKSKKHRLWSACWPRKR